jgi:uncharacterized protein YfaS (alpha-2-macroglobulin family)
MDYTAEQKTTTFGSKFRDESLMLQTLSIMNMRDKADDLVKVISERLSSDRWCSTQEIAQALIAMSKFVGEAGVSAKVDCQYRLAGGSWQTISSKKPLWQLDLDGEQATSLEVKNNTGKLLFVRLISDGIPANQDETESSEGLEMTIKYVTLDGKVINPKKIDQGTDFRAEVSIKNTGLVNYHELALHHVFPAGWEIHNARLTGATTGGDKPEYQDIRDDRVYTFFDLAKGKTKTFNILLNASYLGKYYLPAVSVEAMYDKSINARKRGHWATVEKGLEK